MVLAMSETPWLDQDQQRAWRGWIEATRRVHALLEKDLRGGSGLAMDDYEVLMNLSEADGGKLQMSALGAKVVQSPSRLSQRVDRMEAAGFVRRERSPNDGRVFFVYLTDEGLQKLETAAAHHVVAVRAALIDQMNGDEVAFLADLLPRLAERLRAPDTQSDPQPNRQPDEVDD